MDDLLVTSTWDVSTYVFYIMLGSNIIRRYKRQHGWRTAKRPGVDYFLGYLSQFYEVVVFTTQYHYVRFILLQLAFDTYIPSPR